MFRSEQPVFRQKKRTSLEQNQKMKISENVASSFFSKNNQYEHAIISEKFSKISVLGKCAGYSRPTNALPVTTKIDLNFSKNGTDVVSQRRGLWKHSLETCTADFLRLRRGRNVRCRAFAQRNQWGWFCYLCWVRRCSNALIYSSS